MTLYHLCEGFHASSNIGAKNDVTTNKIADAMPLIFVTFSSSKMQETTMGATKAADEIRKKLCIVHITVQIINRLQTTAYFFTNSDSECF